MAVDPILRIAQQRIIKLSAELESDLVAKGGRNSMVLEIWRRLRERGAESLAALPFVDPDEVAKIRTLQHEVKRYDEFCGCLRDIVREGIQLDRSISDEERQELTDMLTETEEGRREAVELGLVNLEQADA